MFKFVSKIMMTVMTLIFAVFCLTQASFAATESKLTPQSVFGASDDYHFYAGFVLSGQKYKGIYARIKLPEVLPDVSGSGESAWVSTNKDDNGEWLQTGVRYYSGYDGFKLYYEYYVNGKYECHEPQSVSLGNESTYWIQYNDSSGKWQACFAENNSSTGKILASSVLSTAENNGVQVNAELHKEGIQMGPFDFSGVMYYDNSDGAWHANTKMPTTEPPYEVSGSANNFKVYGPVSD